MYLNPSTIGTSLKSAFANFSTVQLQQKNCSSYITNFQMFSVISDDSAQCIGAAALYG